MSQKNKRKAVHKNRKTDDVEKQREDTDPELTEWEKSRRRIWIYVKVSSVFALLIVTLYAGKWVYESNKLTTLEEECRVAKKKGDWITLEIKAREWASWEPDNYMPWMYAATAVQENGGTPTELAAYLKQLPENAPFLAFQELSDIRYRSGEVKDAAKIFEQLVERDPTSVEAHRRLNFYYAMTVQRAKLINESMRILVYFFHTMGELCISPVALSYVSKLVPGRMIAMMFGIWYLAVAIGMKLAGVFGEASEGIAKSEGLSYFFWLLTAVAIGLGVLSAALYPVIKKLMHGVR